MAERGRTGVYRLRHALCGGRAIQADIGNDAGQVFSGFRRPATRILRAEHLPDPLAYLLVGKELASIQLFEAFPHLLPKPRVMVQVLLHKLLNIGIRTGAILGRGAVNLRLNLGREMNFRRLQGKDLRGLCQACRCEA